MEIKGYLDKYYQKYNGGKNLMRGIQMWIEEERLKKFKTFWNDEETIES